jgi:hypothetical protein
MDCHFANYNTQGQTANNRFTPSFKRLFVAGGPLPSRHAKTEHTFNEWSNDVTDTLNTPNQPLPPGGLARLDQGRAVDLTLEVVDKAPSEAPRDR